MAAEGEPSRGAAQQHRTYAVERGAEGAPLSRRVFLSLGSNLGDRAAYLGAAREALAALPATVLVAASRLYETAPQDLPDQDGLPQPGRLPRDGAAAARPLA